MSPMLISGRNIEVRGFPASGPARHAGAHRYISLGKPSAHEAGRLPAMVFSPRSSVWRRAKPVCQASGNVPPRLLFSMVLHRAPHADLTLPEEQTRYSKCLGTHMNCIAGKLLDQPSGSSREVLVVQEEIVLHRASV